MFYTSRLTDRSCFKRKRRATKTEQTDEVEQKEKGHTRLHNFSVRRSPELETITISPFDTLITMLNEESYYDILGVDEDATASEIRRAFLEWSRKFHPDKHPQASPAEKKEFTEAFQRINQAYEILRDHREDYDYERRFYGAKSHSETPRQESGFPYYSKAKKEDSQPSSAKKKASSSGNTQKEENARNANARAKKTDSKQQSRAKPQKTPKTPPRSRDQEPAFGTRADGQPCKRCQMYGKFCFQHQYQDPRFYNRSPKDSESNKDEKEREKPSPSGADSDSSEEHAFGKRADGQPCKRCQLQGKFCFQHVHQDSRFQKESRDDFPRCNEKERSKSSPSSAGYGSCKRHTFGTRADGQPCKRCQMQGKFCFQHVHQDPQFADKGAKESTNKKSKASPFTNNARKQHVFGTRADGQQCKRCQVQGKFCFQHAHQDPTFHDKKEEHGESMNGHKNARKAPNQNCSRLGTRADGQPCRRCEMQGKYCFQHTHQDPQFV